MLFNNEQTTEQITSLFTEARNYWQLQRKNLSLETSEVLSKLLSAVALWALVILIGALVLLFGSFAVAYLLGNLLGSQVWGFTIIAVVLLLLVMLIYANRRAWIVVPIGKFVIGIFASQMAAQTREAVALERAHVKESIGQSESQMRQSANALFTPQPESKDRFERASRLLANGMSIYRALQIGLSALTAFQTVFGFGRLRRRRK